ncbi:hypothetical protein LIER_28556 [Lithospermum erythrorhizon]|uniref:Uncharacterized protein n=1 Tax=Lithospermum erythrorhizon TaxID=34254 RepID=A0AAV3RG62_LITER
MKTISGNLVSKAARYVSDFASFVNNGVSDVVYIYLNHASEAFNSLVQLNKDLKHPHSSHKMHKKSINQKKKDASLRNDETMNYDDGGMRIRNRDEMEERRGEERRREWWQCRSWRHGKSLSGKGEQEEENKNCRF